jgi:endonuclease/exonuclease/phosphatase family metal-dependent hydrolase
MSIKIATWNLDHASKNNSRKIDPQVDIIKGINADIWILTETCSQVDISPLGYRPVVPEHKNKYQKYWSTIWSRVPIRNEIRTYDTETAVCAEVEITPDISMIVYGTIITWQMDKGRDGKSKPWEEHNKSIIDHGADWSKIISQNKQSIFCVAGDFNQPRDGSNWYFAHTSNRNGIMEMSRQLAGNDLSCLTSDDFHTLIDRHNVDHICISSRCKEFCKTVDVWYAPDLSDHNGVWVELQL